jgi:hypothetical protein
MATTVNDPIDTTDDVTLYGGGAFIYVRGRELRGEKTHVTTVRVDREGMRRLRDYLSGQIGEASPEAAPVPLAPLTDAEALALKPGTRLQVLSNEGSSRYTVGEIVTFARAEPATFGDPVMVRIRERHPGQYAHRFAVAPGDQVVEKTLADFTTEDLTRELASRIKSAPVSREAIQGRPGRALPLIRTARSGICDGIWWGKMPGGLQLWCAIDDALTNAERTAEDAATAEADAKRGFLAPCPTGYGTVLGHLVQQGKEPEDLGLREGIRLARLAKDEGVSAIWVEASPALADICKRVRAYPAAFLVKHLGDVDPAHALVGGEAPAA